MCGIAIINPNPDSDLPIRALSRWLLHSLAPRGRDAAGVAWKRQDGTTLYRKVQGHPLRLASNLAAVKGSRSLDTAATVMLHTRYGTVGSPAVTENNHPIIRPGVVMVHNGTIRNARQMYALAAVKPMAEVDSDAIAALIETAPDVEVLLDRLERVKGPAALAWLEVTDEPAEAGVAWCARLDTRPLVVAWTRKGDLVAASTMEALDVASKCAGVKLRRHWHLPEGTVLQVKDGEVIGEWTIDTGSGAPESVIEYATGGVAMDNLSPGVDTRGMVTP